MDDGKISSEQVRHVARLARLQLDDVEVEALRGQLDAILGYVAALDAVDVTALLPSFHAIPILSPLREDVATPGLTRERALAAAPASDGEGFAVPKVLEGA
ncbi:MAG: Asp-tRNA(Asn)/Glu-tRNA(Gln) amidotransferase subunit GatC [Myxococcales bacterium]|nr:Asp-tRNA(Asn)/Glu-tRNA(Gln) amidotransferase subunit GatC [Myxococcales bacterium]MCB9626692.1 Asp-tRNA(Asn)/Glu-tRNA(Gln) amidotransferase subunit GatC [Sandaracinaceae bacterium]